jgi:SAM-dependent methyltransferase
MIDVGAGIQPFADLFGGRVDRIIAVERPSGSPTTGVGLWGDAQALPLRTGTADTVLCVEVLEYLPDPRRALQEFARILRQGGRLILTAPQIRGASNEPNDYWRFGHPGLRLLAAQAGLDEIVITPCGGICAAYGQRLGSWLYHSLVEGLGLPRRPVRIVCGLILAASWLADQTGIGGEETLHWLLTARRP